MSTIDSMEELDKAMKYVLGGYSHLGTATLVRVGTVRGEKVATFKLSDGFTPKMFDEDFKHGMVMAVK